MSSTQYVLPGALVKIIASIAHFLVVERSCHSIIILWQASLQIYSIPRVFLAIHPVVSGCFISATSRTWMGTNSIPSVAYPLNDSCTITYYRFTMPYLRTCFTCRCCSLAHLCHYAVVGLTWPLSPRLSYVYLLDPSDGILEGTVPVKLPTRHVPLF